MYRVDVSEFRSWDDFFWPGTEVLANRLGMREPAQLDPAERALTYGRLVELGTTSAVPGRFDLAHLQAIHGYLFQDIYDWAGQVRTYTLTKGESEFCRPEHLASYAAEVFARLAGNDFLRGLETDSFVHEAAELLGDLNALHPFGKATDVASGRSWSCCPTPPSIHLSGRRTWSCATSGPRSSRCAETTPACVS